METINLILILQKIRNKCLFSFKDDNFNDYNSLIWDESNEQDKPSLEEIKQAKKILEQEQNNAIKNYSTLRKNNYPSIEDQLDILYHFGYEGWKNIITDIKLRYPKNK